MSPTLAYLLGVLATWRLARDYVHEEGPLGLYGRSRRWLRAWAEQRIEAADVDDPRGHEWYWLYEGVACIVCVTFWAALLVAVLVAWRQGWGLANGLLTWFGLAGGALVLERLYERPRTNDE